MKQLALAVQDEVCGAVEALDGGRFRTDQWDRPGGGGGWSRTLQDSRVYEKAGVGVSVVHGVLPDDAARAMRARKDLPDERAFFAAGVSMVLHPHNPFCPTMHANFRYFELGDGAAWWFGGGADLTPSYLFEDDARHFHATLKAACDRHDAAFYPRFKQWCDEYFLVRHRGETRGVGGIFFDDLDGSSASRPADSDEGGDRERLFGFVSDAAHSLVPAYLPIATRRANADFGPEHKRWQQIRRGRYVEFNLVYDRGTLFGLKTDARIESVLMSLPLTARWEIDHRPEPGSDEERLVEVLKSPRSWT
jgi:coproporphyrinogen III oxidase